MSLCRGSLVPRLLLSLGGRGLETRLPRIQLMWKEHFPVERILKMRLQCIYSSSLHHVVLRRESLGIYRAGNFIDENPIDKFLPLSLQRDILSIDIDNLMREFQPCIKHDHYKVSRAFLIWRTCFHWNSHASKAAAPARSGEIAKPGWSGKIWAPLTFTNSYTALSRVREKGRKVN